jgi:alpha-tubulin suppressor-like RCC1 family protein
MQDGTASCWGENTAGQLGDGKTSRTAPDGLSPQRFPVSANIVNMAVGYVSICAILADATVTCSGVDDTKPAMSRDTPAPLAFLAGVATIAQGDLAHCALLADRTAECWGPQPETGFTPAPAVVPGLTGVVDMALSASAACARLVGGDVACWGDDLTSLGPDGRPESHTAPTVIDALRGAKQIVMATAFRCAIDARDDVVCWGGQVAGELGDGAGNSFRTDPRPVQGIHDVAEIAAGFDHACARTSDGAVYCWGTNGDGQIGDGTTTARAEPVRVTF